MLLAIFCPTFLVPSLSPGQGWKKGAEYVPNHGGGVFETQIGVKSVRRQTATGRFRLATVCVTLIFTKRLLDQSRCCPFPYPCCDNFDLSSCSMNCFRCWMIEVLPRWRPGQETERWDPLGLESPNIGGWCGLARAEVDGSDELWLWPQPVALGCLQPAPAAVLLSDVDTSTDHPNNTNAA